MAETLEKIVKAVLEHWMIQFGVLIGLAYLLAGRPLYSFAALVGAGAVLIWKSFGSVA